jgi:hypothetical protein
MGAVSGSGFIGRTSQERPTSFSRDLDPSCWSMAASGTGIPGVEERLYRHTYRILSVVSGPGFEPINEPDREERRASRHVHLAREAQI